MKKMILLLALIITEHAFCQETKLSGIYTEYKRTLLNGEDGSKYTIDQTPFIPKLQFEFKGKIAIQYNGSMNTENTFTIVGDTLILGFKFGKDQNVRTIYTKYIIIEDKNELVLREFKDDLGEYYFLRKFYFRKSKAFEEQFIAKNNFDVFTIAEEMPSFPGGVEEMRRFIAEEVSKSTLQGNEKVFLKLLIDPEGKIIGIDILTSPKIEFAAEAIKIIRKFPNFNPGKQNGKTVYVYYNVLVKFLKS